MYVCMYVSFVGLYAFPCARAAKSNQTNMYIASARAQFKINTHRCWNWHLCIPDGLSVVQCSLGHVIGIVFFTQFQWHEAIVLDNWKLAELPQSGGRGFEPHRVHDNLSVPLWVYMRFPVSEHQNQTKQECMDGWMDGWIFLVYWTYSSDEQLIVMRYGMRVLSYTGFVMPRLCKLVND